MMRDYPVYLVGLLLNKEEYVETAENLGLEIQTISNFDGTAETLPEICEQCDLGVEPVYESYSDDEVSYISMNQGNYFSAAYNSVEEMVQSLKDLLGDFLAIHSDFNILANVCCFCGTTFG